MTTKIVTPPAALAVSLADAKLSLREDGTDKDALITAWIRGITAHAEHYTGRSFSSRSMRATLDEFPTSERGGPGAICLDCPPIMSVESVTFYDVAGVLQTLDPQDYIADVTSEPGWVVPATGKVWPATFDRIDSVMVDYTAGYGAVPEALNLYVLAKLAEQFDHSDWVKKDTVQSSYIDCLLDPLKVYA